MEAVEGKRLHLFRKNITQKKEKDAKLLVDGKKRCGEGPRTGRERF